MLASREALAPGFMRLSANLGACGMSEAVRFDDVVAAVPIVRRWLPRTPTYEYDSLSRQLDCRFWLKHENHLPVGAFKVRGGVNRIEALTAEERRRGVIAVSTGNHGLSLAWACGRMNVPCTIVVPEAANPDKLSAMQSLGAELIQVGRDFDQAKQLCEQWVGADSDTSCRARHPSLRGRAPLYVHSANEPKLIAGVGTYALEIFDDVPDPDVLIVPIGLGSGICGAAIVAEQLSPRTRVIGVQAEGAPAVAQSWRTGTTVTTDRIETHAEGLATRGPASLTLAIMRRLVDEIVLVSDREIEHAIRLLLATTHNLAEGAGASATAAAIKLRGELAGKQVVAVLSGGNLDLQTLPKILAAAD
jgi:threonine dehydratase